MELLYELIISSNVELTEFVISSNKSMRGSLPEGINIKYNENRRKFKVVVSDAYLDQNNIPAIFLGKHVISKIKEYIEENNLNGKKEN